MILDGKKVSQEIREQLRQRILNEQLHKKLAIILVGDDPASLRYTQKKHQKAQEIGITSFLHHLPSTSTEEEVAQVVDESNAQADGVMVQLPLPPHLNSERILNRIAPEKDVDGLTAVSLGKLLQKDERCAPATPLGIIRLLEAYPIPFLGKEVVILSRSALIGKPLALLFLNRGATVTVCHSQTREIKAHTLRADILVSAIGKPRLVTEDMVKSGAVVVDAGTAEEAGQLVGDVDFTVVEKKASYITPVPGGVGPMTIAQLLANVVQTP